MKTSGGVIKTIQYSALVDLRVFLVSSCREQTLLLAPDTLYIVCLVYDLLYSRTSGLAKRNTQGRGLFLYCHRTC